MKSNREISRKIFLIISIKIKIYGKVTKIQHLLTFPIEFGKYIFLNISHFFLKQPLKIRMKKTKKILQLDHLRKKCEKKTPAKRGRKAKNAP